MKKNLWFKLGLFCAALVLVATCFISTAWAKYTSTATLTDSARVAKFEVKNQGNGFSSETLDLQLFDTTLEHIYKTDGKNKNSEKIIAPGSKGSKTITVESKSEVDVLFTFSGSDTNTKNIPLVFTIEGDNSGVTYDTFIAAVQAAFGDASARTIAANTEENGITISETINWEWKYNNSNDSNDTDTALGKDGNAEYKVELILVATQVKPGTSTSTTGE